MKSVGELPIRSEVFPILWSDDVANLVNWAVSSLGLKLSWSVPSDHRGLAHAELLWPGGRVSINSRREEFRAMGPSGISLRVDDKKAIEAVFKKAVAAGAEIIQTLDSSPIAYSFTAQDPDGNQWWVNAETGFLDELRNEAH